MARLAEGTSGYAVHGRLLSRCLLRSLPVHGPPPICSRAAPAAAAAAALVAARAAAALAAEIALVGLLGCLLVLLALLHCRAVLLLLLLVDLCCCDYDAAVRSDLAAAADAVVVAVAAAAVDWPAALIVGCTVLLLCWMAPFAFFSHSCRSALDCRAAIKS